MFEGLVHESSQVRDLHEVTRNPARDLGGLSKILEKINEESDETIQAAKEYDHEIENSKKAVVHETADLWFHTLVMLSHLNLGPNEVLEELKKRFNISGLDEKASRKS